MVLLDVLILEDQQKNRVAIASQIPDAIRYRFALTSREFRTMIEQGERARNYFLDNHVHNLQGRLEYMFLEHYAFLREFDEDGTVFYIGADPSRSEIDFCEDNGICIISRERIGQTILENY